MIAHICNGVRNDGTACTAKALPDAPYCWAHDDRPDAAAKRDAARRLGGRQRSAVRRAIKHLPPEIADAQLNVIELLADTRAGRVQARVAEVFFAGVRVLLEIAKFADERGTQRELDERLQALEAAVNLPGRKRA
jgi:hypothetical protein